ncbi:hypothetical protein BB560_005583 [Smittium megazygosporum]|uniref:GATOR2 complex protein MIO zinc-ribbon like domain-containing protein n=1 Tax=Smittium megazygosporum TaxID=133381 RepID=A0A2T9Z2T6_9FUNG|nr:hypothetical protein BB560_005583 [Smittium megazygosporum]
MTKKGLSDLAFELIFYNENRHTSEKSVEIFTEPLSVKSTQWLPKYPSCIATGVFQENSSIRIFDTNSPLKSNSAVFYENPVKKSKPNAIYGIEFDPFNEYRFLAHDKRSNINIYDIRWPFLCISLETKSKIKTAISEVHYSNISKDTISVLGSNQSTIVHWNINQNHEQLNETSLTDAFLPLSAKSRKRSDLNSGSLGTFISPRVNSISFSPVENSDGSSISSFAYPFVYDCKNQANQPALRQKPEYLLAYMSNHTAFLPRVPSKVPFSIGPYGEIVSSNPNFLETRTHLPTMNKNTPSFTNKLQLQFYNDDPRKVSSLSLDKGKSVYTDILTHMYIRAKNGYGFDPNTNCSIVYQDTSLCNVWRWIRDVLEMKKSFEVETEDHVDFCFSGILSIIYSIPSLGEKLMARFKESAFCLNIDSTHKTNETDKSDTPENRLSILTGNKNQNIDNTGSSNNLLGENFINHKHKLNKTILENSEFWLQRYASLLTCAQDKITEAVCTCLGYGQFELAIEILTESKSEQLDETTKSLIPFKSRLSLATASVLEKNFSNPVLQVIFDFLKSGSWLTAIKNTSSIKFLDKIALSLVYLNDTELEAYLHEIRDSCNLFGNLEGLLLCGLEKNGIELISKYVDNTGDIQTAALISGIWPYEHSNSNGNPKKCELEVSEQWRLEYRKLLNRWTLYNEKCLFDVESGNLRESKGLKRTSEYFSTALLKTVNVRCSYCRTGVGYQLLKRDKNFSSIDTSNMTFNEKLSMIQQNPSLKKSFLSINGQPNDLSKTSSSAQMAWTNGLPSSFNGHQLSSKVNYTRCPKCFNKLPDCSVCRSPLGTPKSDNFFHNGSGTDYSDTQNSIDSWFVWCQNCGHGGHYSHITSWFANNTICPSLDCSCNCSKM